MAVPEFTASAEAQAMAEAQRVRTASPFLQPARRLA
jgi:hypothetical protein